MIFEVLYAGHGDRQRQIAKHEAQGERMLTDTFVVEGRTDAGIMIFTDLASAPAIIGPDLATELSGLKRRIEILEAKP